MYSTDMNNYTQEQVEDIKEREAKALDTLKELNLTPACQVFKVNVGNDTFADKVVPYLQDTKYANPTKAETPVADK